jgi:glucokinase
VRIGIDIGGTSAKLGLVDDGGGIARRGQVPTGPDLAPDALVALLAEQVAELTAGGGARSLGIAAPGMRRPDGEGVVNVTNLPLIHGYPLRARLEAATGLPAFLDNDANAAAVGEYRYGAGRGSARLLVVTVGTGIGAGMVVDGAVHRIACEGLGDPGHVLVQRHGPQCGCGARGCVEAIASVPAILRRAAELRAPEPPFPDYRALVTAIRAGEPAAVAAFSEAADYLGMALATHLHLLAPDRLLLGGGGVDGAGDLLLEPVRRSLFAQAQPYLAERLTFGRAKLGNDAGVIGAAALAA